MLRYVSIKHLLKRLTATKTKRVKIATSFSEKGQILSVSNMESRQSGFGRRAQVDQLLFPRLPRGNYASVRRLRQAICLSGRPKHE
jgi:hypothetical protein